MSFLFPQLFVNSYQDSVCVSVCFSREIRFRKRAQSADDEGSVELAESLQHLTLSEFLKEYV